MPYIISLDKTFHFGKYFGRKVEEIVKEDPKYIKWLMENRKSFIVSQDVIDELEK